MGTVMSNVIPNVVPADPNESRIKKINIARHSELRAWIRILMTRNDAGELPKSLELRLNDINVTGR